MSTKYNETKSIANHLKGWDAKPLA